MQIAIRNKQQSRFADLVAIGVASMPQAYTGPRHARAIKTWRQAAGLGHLLRFDGPLGIAAEATVCAREHAGGSWVAV